MRRLLDVLLGAAVFLAIGTPAWAQGGFVHGLGGVTFGTETGPVFGGGGGFNFGQSLQLFGEFGRMGNVLPTQMQEDLDEFTDLLSDETGLTVTIDAKVPAIYGMGGLRYTIPTGGRVRPYVEAAVGFARLSLDIEAEVGGIDLSELIEDEVGLDETATETLLVLGGGINIAVNDTLGLDFGYRWNGIFTEDPMINASEVYGGVRINFR
jgi:opacity protein-like surface antigen